MRNFPGGGRFRLLAAFVLLIAVASGCSTSPRVDTAGRDRCEAKWGVGNCVERSDKWVPLAKAITTTTAPSTTTAAPTTTTEVTTTVTDPDPAVRNLTVHIHQDPSLNCGDSNPSQLTIRDENGLVIATGEIPIVSGTNNCDLAGVIEHVPIRNYYTIDHGGTGTTLGTIAEPDINGDAIYISINASGLIQIH